MAQEQEGKETASIAVRWQEEETASAVGDPIYSEQALQSLRTRFGQGWKPLKDHKKISKNIIWSLNTGTCKWEWCAQRLLARYQHCVLLEILKLHKRKRQGLAI